eukprot:CAMPEP_0182477582 /NCGR_PEP_ID=MMETSP1319-20130603/31109_1 /TAXON_ID=172717 /ORGANISM="Bolidomonas pacifica, Strain RCC208" /LENGTH=213 /DNA_ID=CAMNT_0024678831 /DNA_START=64 /DNA_END=701 /DNA_ORIENTATION=+
MSTALHSACASSSPPPSPRHSSPGPPPPAPSSPSNHRPRPPSIATSSPPSSPPPSNFLPVMLSLLGTTLEWYDFSLFAYLAPILSKLFFPPCPMNNGDGDGDGGTKCGEDGLVETFVIFGLAFFARPLGGILVGRLGDKLGRKKALALSVLAMSCSTFSLGLLPTYSQVGALAPVLLATVRVVQGLSVGGQLPSCALYILENAPEEKQGVYSA